MAAKLEQGQRRLRVETPLGKDRFLLESFAGQEEISRPFRFELLLLSHDHGIAAADIIGKALSFEVADKGGESRGFHGRVARFAAGSLVDRDLRRYHASVVPWYWFLSKRSGCRIFQHKTALQIAEQIFDELGFSDYDASNVRGQLPELEFSVQYRESDLDYLGRLFEEAGIFYFFRHETQKHTLVLADAKLAYADCKQHDVPYGAGTVTKGHITRWEHRWQFVSGAWMHSDYNFETPSTKLRSSAKTLVKLPGTGAYEVYEHPGGYADGGAGDGLAQIRMEQEEAGWDVVEGSSTCKSFTLGGRFRLSSHECQSETDKDYVLTSVAHRASDSSALHEGTGGTDYQNEFTCIPASVVYRPARSTPRPVISGPQTAVVVGPGGEEIHSDPHGRIKVQFHWDREGKNDENSSCWIRVAQSWAGKSWGTVFLPRIGQEVVVEFLEGDPDRPLITGSVYNADQTPPYELPANQMKSGIKTRSTKGGDPETFNELRFEDKKDSELVYFHSQKDQHVVVEHDQTVEIGNDQSIKVGNNRTEDIGKDRELKVGANKSEDVAKDKAVTVGGNHTESITGDMSLSVGKGRTLSVAKNLSEDVGGSHSLSVDKDQATTISGARTLDVTKDSTITVQGGESRTITKTCVLKAKSIQIEAEDEILLKAGDASVQLKSNGDISIKGGKIKIEGSGDVTIKGSKVSQN